MGFFSFFFFFTPFIPESECLCKFTFGHLLGLSCLVLLKRLDSLSAVEIITPVSYNSCRGKGFSKICLDNSL